MMYDNKLLFENVLNYCKRKGAEVERQDSLGHGSDGAVWKTSIPSAVKAFYKQANYEIELECYQRLKQAGVNKIHGFNIPMLEGFDDTLRVIEITFVRPPYFLDFGKATTDDRRKEYRDPQFLAKAIHSWQQDFGAKWKEVAAVIHYLKDKHEILYLDPRRGNVNFGDAEDDNDWLAEPGIDYSEYE